VDERKILKDPIYFKIVSFFHENPASIDTPRGIATWVGENRRVVKKVLSDLARLKILTAHKAASTTGYSYTRDPAVIKRIGAYLKRSRAKKDMA